MIVLGTDCKKEEAPYRSWWGASSFVSCRVIEDQLAVHLRARVGEDSRNLALVSAAVHDTLSIQRWQRGGRSGACSALQANAPGLIVLEGTESEDTPLDADQGEVLVLPTAARWADEATETHDLARKLLAHKPRDMKTLAQAGFVIRSASRRATVPPDVPEYELCRLAADNGIISYTAQQCPPPGKPRWGALVLSDGQHPHVMTCTSTMTLSRL